MKVKLFDNNGPTTPMEGAINDWLSDVHPKIIDFRVAESSACCESEGWRGCTVLFLYKEIENGETVSHE